MFYQIVGYLHRRKLGEALLHQRGQTRHVGRCLAGAGEPAIVSVMELWEIRFIRSRFGAGRTDDVGLDPPVGRRASAAVGRDGVGVPVVGRAYRQQARIGAFCGVADASALGIVLNGCAVEII